MIKPRLLGVLISALFLFTSCGGGGSGSNSANSQTDLPNDINGLLVFGKSTTDHSDGVYLIDIKNGKVIKDKSILSPIIDNNGLRLNRYQYARDRETIVHKNECGEFSEDLKVVSEKGLVSQKALTPCGVNYVYVSRYDRRFIGSIITAKVSPDKKKITVVVKEDDEYHTLIYNRNTLEEIKHYEGYIGSEWHPDGRLLLIGPQGLYLSDKSFSNLNRIDKGQLNSYIGNPDISPSGKQVVFEMNGDIWIMDIDGNNLNILIESQENLIYPTWSPDGKYIAYLAYITNYLKKITFFNINSKQEVILDTRTIFPVSENNFHIFHPAGPLSWVR